MKLLLLLFLSCTAALADSSVSYYPYDYCDTTTHKLAWPEKGEELRLAQARVTREFLCGAYSGIMDQTSGNTVHIFPDGSAMLTSWTDIGPTGLVAQGRWAIKGNIVRINWSKNTLSDREQKFFVAYHGLCKELFLYLSFDDTKAVREVYLVSRDKDAEKIEYPLWKRESYVDWPKIKSELSKKED